MTLQAFTSEEASKADRLLKERVIFKMGEKMEESDWAYVYSTAKGIEIAGWSNLNIDVTYNGIGIEHKMLKVKSDRPIKHFCGTSLLHPSITRQIRTEGLSLNAEDAKRDILRQYSEFIDRRLDKVARSNPGQTPSLRTGLLLWQDTLKEFLYFEEEIRKPNPDDFYAEWKENNSGPNSSRLSSRNLWIYEASTGRKRFSITTSAGAKIQGYFDIPSPLDDNLHYFLTQGELISDGVVRIWVSEATHRSIIHSFGNIDKALIDRIVMESIERFEHQDENTSTNVINIYPIEISQHVYCMAIDKLGSVNDDQMMQKVISLQTS